MGDETTGSPKHAQINNASLSEVVVLLAYSGSSGNYNLSSN